MREQGCVIALMVLLGNGGSAVTGQQTQTLDQFLWGPDIEMVSATRESQHPYDVPATVVVITAQMIRERGYRELTDILEDIPGFDLSPNVYGEFSTLIAQRGIGGNNKLVIMLDGNEITSPEGKQFPLGHNVPISLAKRIEIVYGPASALYGPDAFGVINIITKEPRELDGVEATVISGSDRTYDTSIQLGKQVNDDVDFTVYGRFFGTDGQDLSGKYPELRSIRSYPALVRNRMEDPVADWNLHARIRLKDITLSMNHSYYREQLSKGLDPAQYVYNKEAYWGQSLTNLNLEHRYKLQQIEITSRAYFSAFEIDPDMSWYYLIRDDAGNSHSTARVYQYGKAIGSGFDTHAAYTPTANLGFSGGLVFENVTGMGVSDVYGEPFDRDAPLYINNYGIPQAAVSSENYGVYGQLKWKPVRDISLFAGARYDYNTIYEGSFNPRLGLVWSRPGSQAFKILYGTGYIAPSYFIRYETWFLEEYGHIQNPDLKPERLQTLEINWSRNWTQVMESSVDFYVNHVRDMIVGRNYGYTPMAHPFVDANGDGQVFVEWSDNFGTLRSYGADLRVDYVPSPDFRMYGGYSFMDGYNADPNTGDHLDLFKTSTHKLTAGVTWYPHTRFSISPRIRWVSDIATREENSRYAGDRMPGHGFVNLHVRLHQALPHMDAYMTISNVFDTAYYTPGVRTESSVFLPRVPQNGRSIMLGVTYWPAF